MTGLPGSHSYPNNIGTFARNNGNTYDGPAYELPSEAGTTFLFVGAVGKSELQKMIDAHVDLKVNA